MTTADSRPVLQFWCRGQRDTFSWSRFWSLVDGFVQHLEQSGSPPFVLVFGQTTPQSMAFFLATIASGRLTCYFPPSHQVQDRRYYLAQQRTSLEKINPPAIAIFDVEEQRALTEIAPDLGLRTFVPVALPGNAERGYSLFHAACCENNRALFIQHSSGTTGIKKGVTITAGALQAQSRAYWPLITSAIQTDEVRVASWLPLYHDMGLIAGFLLPILNGATLSIIDPFEWIAQPGLLLDIIETDRCNACWMPNFAFRHFVRLRNALPRRNLGTMKLWIDCSEPCRLADVEAFEAAFDSVQAASVVGCYALAESVFAVTQLDRRERRGLLVPSAVKKGDDVIEKGGRIVSSVADVPPGFKTILSSGRVIPDVTLKVVIDGEFVEKDGLYGEIAIMSPSLFDGYRDGEPARKVDGYFLTGDLGVIIDGHVYVFGRQKEIVIVNGKNIFCGDVEAAVNDINGVKKGRAVAFGLDNEQTGSEDLIIVAEHNGDDDAASVKGAISRRIHQEFLVKPKDVRLVDQRWLVKSTSGKISREENRRRYLEHFK